MLLEASYAFVNLWYAFGLCMHSYTLLCLWNDACHDLASDIEW